MGRERKEVSDEFLVYAPDSKCSPATANLKDMITRFDSSLIDDGVELVHLSVVEGFTCQKERESQGERKRIRKSVRMMQI